MDDIVSVASHSPYGNDSLKTPLVVRDKVVSLKDPYCEISQDSRLAFCQQEFIILF